MAGEKSIQQIVQHKHCINCGRAQPPDKQYCSDKCDEEFQKLQKNKKKVLYITYGMMIFFIIILILQ